MRLLGRLPDDRCDRGAEPQLPRDAIRLRGARRMEQANQPSREQRRRKQPQEDPKRDRARQQRTGAATVDVASLERGSINAPRRLIGRWSQLIRHARATTRRNA